MTYGNGLTETRTYDNDGRIIAINIPAITVPGVLDRRYSWDATNNITGITDGTDAAHSQSFTYDALYRLTSATGGYGNQAWDYDAVGNRTHQSVIPVDTGIQEETAYGYEALSNRLIDIDGTAISYDEAGNTLADGDNAYAYDARNRLVAADASGSAVIPADAGIQYVHNALGQRVSKPRFGSPTPELPGDATGDGVINENDLHALRDIIRGWQIPAPGADCNQDGQITNKDMSCIAQQIGGTKNNGKNNGSVGAPSQARTGNSDRSSVGADSSPRTDTVTSTATLSGNTLFVYDEAGHLLGEYDENGNALKEYLWLGDRPVALLGNGKLHYIHVDHLNTPQVVTDQSQQVVWKADYQPFGEGEVAETSTIEFNLRFPGQYFDAETGLNYNYFRSYDASTGRYTQSDPIGLRGGLNRYSYGYNNSLRYSDPSGLIAPAILACAANPACAAAASAGVLAVGHGIVWAWQNVHNDASIESDSDLAPEQCEEDDGCRLLIAKIQAHVDVMKLKYSDMQSDPYDLYNRARTVNPGADLAGYGTWLGHQLRFDGLRIGLQRMIAEAEAKNCNVPSEAYVWASMKPPGSPRP